MSLSALNRLLVSDSVVCGDFRSTPCAECRTQTCAESGKQTFAVRAARPIQQESENR